MAVEDFGGGPDKKIEIVSADHQSGPTSAQIANQWITSKVST
jgi:hypothetical protein